MPLIINVPGRFQFFPMRRHALKIVAGGRVSWFVYPGDNPVRIDG